MREIKFRFYDVNLCTGTSVFENVSVTSDPKAPDHNRVPLDVVRYNAEGLCQYIGLKDKNGVEIYIGDVITFKIRTGMSSDKHQKKVERDKDMIGVDMQDSNRLCYLVRVSSLDDVEVVGHA